MCTPGQVGREYDALIAAWDSAVVPQLEDLSRLAPGAWRDYGFTYLFDRFCHFLIEEAEVMGLAAAHPRLRPGDRAARRRQFSRFVGEHLPLLAPEPDATRSAQWTFAAAFARRRRRPVPEARVRGFFRRLHPVRTGNFTCQRIRAVERAALSELIEILEVMVDEGLPPGERIALALTPRPRGARVAFLGKACMAEIPGWLSAHQPRCYPIVNAKFVKTLAHLGLADARASCFQGWADQHRPGARRSRAG